MRLLLFYPCLLAILFQAFFASSSLSDKDGTLKTKPYGLQRIRRVAVRLVRNKRSSGAKNKGQLQKPLKKRGSKRSKGSVVVKEDKPKSLSAILPDVLLEIIIGYFINDTYPILVSTHDWLLQDEPEIAVDCARVYVMTDSEGLKGLNHSSANLMESGRSCIEFGDHQWSEYWRFSSSHDGRHVSFSHMYQASTDHGEPTKRSTKWLTQGSKLEAEGFKRVAFDGDSLLWGLLSRDGRTLYSYNTATNVTRIYRITQETGKGPVASTKLAINGIPHAVSSKGSRIIVATNEQFEIHDIGKNASRLVCRIGARDYLYIGALNEDGREAAFATDNGKLQIMEVDKIAGDDPDQPAIVSVHVPKSLGKIHQLVYSDGNKLHAQHDGGKVSLFDPSKRVLIPVEVPQKGQLVISVTISPNADYFASLQYVGKEEKGDSRIYRTTVKRKHTKAELMDLL